MAQWAAALSTGEVIRVRLCYTKHQRDRVAHEVIAGPGYQLMSFVLWLKIIVRLRVGLGEKLTIHSPLLAQEKKGTMVPMTATYMARRDKTYAPVLGWGKATIHSRRRGFATAAVRCGIHMASISVAMRHRDNAVCDTVLGGKSIHHDSVSNRRLQRR